jgi:hypothetical protein
VSKFRPMLGHIVVELLIVDGPPGSAAAFTRDERVMLRQHASSALALLSRLGRGFGDRGPARVTEVCSFDLTVRTVQLPLNPDLVPSTLLAKPHDELKPQRDAVWQAALVRELGYPPSATLRNYTEDQRRFLRGQRLLGRNVADSVTLIVTKYGCHWDGFQEGGTGESEAVVLWFSPIQEGRPEKFGVIMAHEIGHVFDAPDEYGHCHVDSTQGFFDTINANCKFVSEENPTVLNPNPRFQCLMDENKPMVCIATEAHWGWVDGDHDGVADLLRPCEFTLEQMAIAPGQTLRINGTNVWDARTVFLRPVLGGEVTTAVPRVSSAGSILVDIPQTASPWNIVEFTTRVGPAVSASPDLFINDVLPVVFTGTIVWGVLPVNGVPPAPGDRVRILGTELAEPTAVTFGGLPADLTTLVPADPESPFPGDSDITIELPAGVTGTVEVAVTTNSGTSGPFPPFTQLVCQ